MSIYENLVAAALQAGRTLAFSLEDIYAHAVCVVGRDISEAEFQDVYGGALQRQIDEFENRAHLAGLTDDEVLEVMKAVPAGSTLAIDGGVQ